MTIWRGCGVRTPYQAIYVLHALIANVGHRVGEPPRSAAYTIWAVNNDTIARFPDTMRALQLPTSGIVNIVQDVNFVWKSFNDVVAFYPPKLTKFGMTTLNYPERHERFEANMLLLSLLSYCEREKK